MEENRGFFFSFFLFLFFFYHIFVVKVQEIAWSSSDGENKTQNPKRTNKINIRHQSSSSGVRTGPRPTYGREIGPSESKETLLKPADSMKNNKVNLDFLRRDKVTKGNCLRRAGRGNATRGGGRAGDHARGKCCSRGLNEVGECAQEGS